ncbi:putative competence-damage inducible protein [Wickerhamomyces ciferrii]|uniref:Competence-damage inducible protein n=1 Tax=Wickerhamomyces ciferrii (strain ATCC 14091 / BCRC 22168 / CBS 111 / JCM 3599 / NBRC 0793 / NRRL Y-1031 F-60-10) TaxID=1206466 RepID=K0KR30_WICCF|nr:putative competence-damage inducible protein [Wickerhamomyces ciferrii]CCH43743.1 putative competence-damage inducible protein [Wickerhamomyces ciferrii]
MMSAQFPPSDVTEIVEEIASILIKRGETISVSEAACGGLLSAYLVSVPGASQWFHGGTLVYSLKSRLKLSGWSEEDILNYTGPSEKVVLRLARTLRMDLGSTYVLSETGIAGPVIQAQDETGKSVYTNEDIGTVFLGVASPNGESSTVKRTLSNDRSKNMQEFAKFGLEFILDELKKAEGKDGEKDDNGKDDNEKDDSKTNGDSHKDKKQKV